MGPRRGMSDLERYAIDGDAIVSETVDDEAIVVNLANGYYYSFDPTATLVWSAVQAGRSVAEMLAELRGRYDCAATDPEPPLRAFLSALTDEGLIGAGGPEPGPAAGSGSTSAARTGSTSTAASPSSASQPSPTQLAADPALVAPPRATPAGPPAPFRAPAFQRFTDMHAFLLVDPIHEVDETGWPNLLPPGTSAGRA
jgi:hypothetical protein